MIRIIRYFTKDIKDFGLNPEHYVKRTGLKNNKDPISFDPTTMKELFGEDFKTPYEKYDLHLPKSELPDEKSLYERLHEKDKYNSSKKIIRISVFLVIVTSLLSYSIIGKSKKEAKQADLERKEYQKLVAQVEKHNQNLFDKRRREIEELKKPSS